MNDCKPLVYGDTHIKCAESYYKYGCALFYKAQDENTVFGAKGQAAAEARDGANKAAAAPEVRPRPRHVIRRHST